MTPTLLHEAIHIGVMSDTLALDNTFTGFAISYHDFSANNITIKNNTAIISGALAVFTVGSQVDVEDNTVTVTTPKGYQGHAFFEDFGSGYPVAHVYYSNNTVQAQGSGGDGEAFASDGPQSYYTGQVTSASGTNLSMAIDCYENSKATVNNSISPKFWDSQWYMVVIGGTGLGQIRTVTSNGSDNTTFTVDKPWDIEPDGTSRIEIGNWGDDMVYYRNTVTDSSEGLQSYGYDTVWDDNSITNSPSSIIAYDWDTKDYVRCATPAYFTDISNNQFINTGYNVSTSPYIDLLSFFSNTSYDPANSSFPPRLNILQYGVDIKHNTFIGVNAAGQEGLNVHDTPPFRNSELTDVLSTDTTQIGSLINQNTFSNLVTDVQFAVPSMGYTTVLPVAGSTVPSISDGASTATVILP